MENIKNKLKRTGLGKNKRTGVVIIALIIIPVAVGLLAREQQIRNSVGGDVLAEQRTLDVIEKLGELMEIPNEDPTIATVSDVTQLQDQQFFEKAQNGDVVVIFPNAQKAILYRPSTNKIIEIAVYTPPTGSPEAPAQASPTPGVQSLQDLIGGSSPTPALDASPSATENP
jgi:hypothetical protein